MSASIFISYRRSDAGGHAGLPDTDFVRNEVEPQPALKHSLAFRGLLCPRRLQ